MMQVLVLCGSDSDVEVMGETCKVLAQFGVSFKITVASAHRTPERVERLVHEAEASRCKMIIAAAGFSAHLAGMVAAHCTIPVVGVPLASPPLNGWESLMSTVQMPPGVPVATMGVGKSGAINAAHFAVRLLALSESGLKQKLNDYRQSVVRSVEENAKKIEKMEWPAS